MRCEIQWKRGSLLPPTTYCVWSLPSPIWSVAARTCPQLKAKAMSRMCRRTTSGRTSLPAGAVIAAASVPRRGSRGRHIPPVSKSRIAWKCWSRRRRSRALSCGLAMSVVSSSRT